MVKQGLAFMVFILKRIEKNCYLAKKEMTKSLKGGKIIHATISAGMAEW